MANKDVPKDMYFLVKIIFFILGLGTLLPWNFFITAFEYFQFRLDTGNTTESSPDGNGTRVQKDEFNFNNWMTLLAQLPLLLFTLLNSFLYQWISDRTRIVGSLVGILTLFIFTAVLVKAEMSPQTFFSITMVTIWLINSFGAVLQGSLFGLLGLLPHNYSSLFLSGQGMAGTFAAVAMLLSLASGADKRTSALGYFITPCVGTFISILCYLALPHLEFARFYLNRSSAQSYELETRAELLLPDEKNGMPNGILDSKEESRPVKEPRKASVFTVMRKIWLLALCIVLTFTATLSMFPAITASVRSDTGEQRWNDFFSPVCCFLIFSVLDWLGRSTTTYILCPGKDSKLLLPLLVSLRFVFVPLFMLCKIPDRHYLPVVFKQDIWFIIFMTIFSFSNGYFVSLTMCLAPKNVLPHESKTTGVLMTFFLALGLSCGAGLSFLFKSLL
ncbi:equilibrative nucleoside transporter 2 [Microcaecilia unicolor]|uniref:Equilibrative nucleoside transporter 2 n=1 Tax=Microcaecilia unicolor TaxID=1415580 RepID=A0A6P7ZFA8_9AMPH|nr:equilibrative nucleoside transporter 2 [Microcaecilia unicolor]XP_030074269.1 equilibrative nucleoside transporter 2 [Microcaecilia unicolor]XP_030074270.1 equilibrative nucleoside transporter 2 [Microcaecilia unicolor]XP_030074271.1 equilibrative nucleoside transporter 2 [Microcaecilia unicolor]